MNTAYDRDRRPAATAAHLSRRLRSNLTCTRVLFRNGRRRKTSCGACSLRQAQCASHSIPAASAASHSPRQTHTPRARSIAPTVCASQRASCGALCGDPYWSTMARWRPLHFGRATDGFKRVRTPTSFEFAPEDQLEAHANRGETRQVQALARAVSASATTRIFNNCAAPRNVGSLATTRPDLHRPSAMQSA